MEDFPCFFKPLKNFPKNSTLGKLSYILQIELR